MTRRRRLHPLLLALPFLVGVLALQGLTVELETFHGSDARSYHLPTIRLFAAELPTPDLESYPAAQAPLFHLLFAAVGKVAGFELWKLQALNVVISYLAVLALFHLLSARLGLQRSKALALSLLFALSPYFLGASFILLTDNLAILFALVAIACFHRFGDEGSMRVFVLGCLAVAAALLTRQAFVWLVPVGLYYLVVSDVEPRGKLAGLALLGAAVAPLGALIVAWEGLVPKGSDPTSCGVCPTRSGEGNGLSLRAMGFSVAVFGAYAVAVLGPGLLRRARQLRGPRQPRGLVTPLGVVVALAAGVLLLLLSPLEFTAPVPPAPGDAGYLWRASETLPGAGSSLLFWGLVPLGALAAYVLGRRAGPRSPAVVFFVAFLLSTLPVRLVYQKYFDPFALLAVLMAVRRDDLERPLDWAGVAALAVGFVAYAISFEV